MRNSNCDRHGLRILYLANSSQVAGGNRVLLQLCHSIAEYGHVPIVAIPGPGPMAQECLSRGIEYNIRNYRQPERRTPVRTFCAWLHWLRWLRKLDVDIIHANELAPARCIGWPAFWASIPLVCHVHFPPSPSSVRWAMKGIPKPKAFLYCSDSLAKEVQIPIERINPAATQHVVGNALSIKEFQRARKTSNRIPRIGIVAQLTPVKGHGDFIAMARELTDRHLRAEFLIIGEDIQETGYRGQLEANVRDLGLNDRVSFLGHRSDIPSVLSQLDVAVCCSHVEPFGMCLLEAMASECPVVATSIGGIPEVVEDGVTGILVPPRKPQRLADAVQCLIESPDTRKWMGQNGRQRVARHFSQDSYVKRIITIYQEVVGQRGGRHGCRTTPKGTKMARDTSRRQR